jgi:GNAT superfamily N-acetyltransferase
VGFITAISDGVLSAFVSLLEVLPSHQRTGIGTALVRHLLVQLEGLYSISLHCDAGLRSFYERLGLKPLSGMAIRDYSMQAVGTQPDKESREGRALAVDAIAGRVAARDRGLLRRGDALG